MTDKKHGAGHAPAYNPITEGVIWKQILFFFFPLLLSSFFQQLYNTADALIVGRIAGKEALSAVGGSAGSILGIFMMFYVGFAGGAAVLAAQYFGARKEAAVRAAVRTALVICGALGMAGMLLCLVFARFFLGLMKVPADILAPSLTYLRIVALGMVPNALYNMGASALRAIGDSKRPLEILIFTCLCNIVLDLFFVAVLGMGAAGAAVATVLCQLLSSVLVLLSLRRAVFPAEKTGTAPAQAGQAAGNAAAPGQSGLADGSAPDPAPASVSDPAAGSASLLPSAGSAVPKGIAQRILRMGLPLGFTEVMYTFANAVLMAAINSFGTDTVAAYAAYGKIDAVFWMIVGSFGIAITTFVGQNMGAGRWDRVMQSIRDCSIMMFAALGLVIGVLYLCAAPMQSLFCTDPDVIAIGVGMMHFLLPFYVLYIPIEVLFGALRGMGDALVPTLLTFFGVCVLRSAWGIFAAPLHHSVNMVLAGFPITWVVTTIAFTIYFLWYIRRRRPAVTGV